MAAHTTFPASVRPARTRRDPEDHSVRSAVAVVAAGLVLVALLVGGGAVVATLVEMMTWMSQG
ncbi:MULTISPECIES: hypothetical protein [Cellulomonas]|jgi:hypothetical protein|uniref:Uncharacterized protein n=1 Tax=Cellulomonas iranensis TaxID=76862 RepID=A0ABU0GLB3_9CELL|nr:MULTISPECIES: hypothetical protein [Cellulomonas]MDQ0426150.1 hypothetical protein [Cellulomonas iranensis]TFH68309.1 hypothetical protein E4A51_17565 [Cellulomonas sp. HD19AZ1]UCN15569.1 hypothetical protein LFM56_04390 [Cellulomonas iranensis]